jgi:hypothetical protein
LRFERLEHRTMFAGGLLVALPEGFEPAAVGKIDETNYLVAGQFQGRPAVVEVERRSGGAVVTLDEFDGLPLGDGRGAIGDISANAQWLVGASQSDRSDPTQIGEVTFWNAAGHVTAIDTSTIPGTSDMLYAVSEGGVAVGERFGLPMIVTASEGVNFLPAGEGRATAISNNGQIVAGVADGAAVFWTSNVAGQDYTLRSLQLPPHATPTTRSVDVASDGTWIGGVYFALEKFDATPAIWDTSGRLLHAFTDPAENGGIVLDSGVAVVNGVVGAPGFEPATRIFFQGADGAVDLRGWLASQAIDTGAFSRLSIAHDVAHRTTDQELLVLGQGQTVAGERGFLSIVDDFGLPAPTTAALSGRIWNDGDGDGRQDDDEAAGMANVEVTLKTAAGAIVTVVHTNDLGLYEFRGVAPGTYRLNVAAPKTGQYSPRDTTDDRIDSDVNVLTGDTDLVSVAAGQVLRDLDGGITTTTPSRPWRNPVDPLDVDGSGFVSANDLLEIVAEIRRNGIHALGSLTATNQPRPYLDVDGNNVVSLNDALEVIAVLRARLSGAGGEGESPSPSEFHPPRRSANLATELDEWWDFERR